MGEGHAGDLLQGFVMCIGEHAEKEDIVRLTPSVAT
jgi:hypothetical protein